MTLREEIKPFIDKAGYVSPQIPDQDRGSDNGLCFTSEYYILLNRNNELTTQDELDYMNLLLKGQKEPGLYLRWPKDNSFGPPDDLYAILAACKELKLTEFAKDILVYGCKHFGFYNPTNKFNWATFQWRQLQLLFSMIVASGYYKWYKFWYWPLYLYTALCIYVSCKNTPIEDTDSRRLAWHLIQVMKGTGWFMDRMIYIWYKRLYKHYGVMMMSKVASIYYHRDNHPFGRYKWDI